MSQRVVLVTGGTAGIGLGIAQRLGSEGWHVVITGRRPQEDAQEALSQIPGAAAYVRGDVAQAADRAGFVDGAMKAFGRIDALVNNAGITSPGREDFLEATEESFDRVMAVNAKGPYFLAQAVARVMVQQRMHDAAFTGRIVNITSVSASVVSVNRGDYCMSKAALSMATQVMAARLGEFGIDCFEVRPGLIFTDMTAGVKAKYDALIASGILVQSRWGTPADVASAVSCLVRGDLAYAPGQVISIDGGLTILRL